MEGLGGFRSFPAMEEVTTSVILLCAALYCFKSEVGSLFGFRFHPTKEQIFHLLQKKRLDPHFSHHTVRDIDDICSLEPWDLPRESDTELEEQVWYFFYEPYYKYKESSRAHRRTNAGYWKVTGRGSEIIGRNGLTGSKKILTFYRHGPDSKKAKTEWVMHEFHIKNNPSYKKEFVLCRIERKWDNKHGISTPDEEKSSQQLVSSNQLLPSNYLISSANRTDENAFANPHQKLSNTNSIPYPQIHSLQTTLTNQQLPPNNTLIPYSENRMDPNTMTNPQLLPDPILIPYPGNDFVHNTVPYPRLLPPNQNRNSLPWNDNEDHTITTPQPLPEPNLIPYLINNIEQDTVTNTQLLPPNQNSISLPSNLIEEHTITNRQPLPNQILETQPLQNQPFVISNVTENTYPEEHLQHGEFNACGANNGLNNAFFPAPQSPFYPEREFLYSDCSRNNCDFLNFQVEQVNDLNNLWACQDGNSFLWDWTNPYPRL